LVFQNDQSYFLSWLFKKGFKHCFILERQALGWVCLDASRYDLYPVILPASYLDDVAETFARLNPSSTVLELTITKPYEREMTYPKVGLISCVAVIQYALGVHWPFTVTPYQLYCRLLDKENEHIKVGKLWAGKGQEEVLKRQRMHQEQKHKR